MASVAAGDDLVLGALTPVVTQVTRVVRGHDDVVKLAVAALLARGHILLEDVPGVGKTTLARALARVLGSSFARVQFTADMLPSDVLGSHILDPATQTLQFRKGPIFSDVVLADEINRASPRTQSALLEAMAERKVSVDDSTHALSPTFAVLATQNPLEHHGAYPLPESQLDRFMVRLSLGYPSAEIERALILSPAAPEKALLDLPVLLGPERLMALQSQVDQVKLADPVATYLLAIVEATRTHPDVMLGASPRASIAFASIARAWALLAGRAYVVPDDLRVVAVPVLAHRLSLAASDQLGADAKKRSGIITNILARTAVPR